MSKRVIFDSDHEAFRDSVRRFVLKEITPHVERWRHEGIVAREVWRKAGEQSLLCMWADDTYGGAGIHDCRSDQILVEDHPRPDVGVEPPGGADGQAIFRNHEFVGDLVRRRVLSVKPVVGPPDRIDFHSQLTDLTADKHSQRVLESLNIDRGTSFDLGEHPLGGCPLLHDIFPRRAREKRNAHCGGQIPDAVRLQDCRDSAEVV